MTTVVVAAANALPESKANADFVCVGTNDQLLFQKVIDSLNGF